MTVVTKTLLILKLHNAMERAEKGSRKRGACKAAMNMLLMGGGAARARATYIKALNS